jgi:predicted nucleotidyltransferase
VDLSEPIAAIVPTLDGPALRVLAATSASASARELHRRAGVGSEDGLRRSLNRLTHQGVVTAERVGQSVQYLLNREHVAFPAVELLVGMRRELLARIAEHTRSWEPAPRFVGVYGSAARGDGDAESDIDLLVIAEAVDDDAVASLADRVVAWSGNRASITVLTPTELAEAHTAREPIVEQWRHDLVPLVGMLRELALA